MTSPGALLVVAAALVDDLDTPRRLLAARRSQPLALAGGWELPGGKVEAGEEPAAALHRELAEELGIQVRLGAEVPGPADGAWPLPPRGLFRLWWAVIEEGTPEPLEDHDELCWLEPGDWESVPWLTADLPAVRQLAHLAGHPARRA